MKEGENFYLIVVFTIDSTSLESHFFNLTSLGNYYQADFVLPDKHTSIFICFVIYKRKSYIFIIQK